MEGVIVTKWRAVGDIVTELKALPSREKFDDFKDFKLGKITEIEFWRRVNRILNTNLEISKLKSAMCKTYEIIPHMLPLIKGLKQQGYKLYILSNIPHEWVCFVVKKFALDKLFDGMLFSCDFGMDKPHAEFYELLLDKYNLNPKSCIFIDDFTENIDAAKRLGFKTILFEDAATLKNQLHKFGISI
ncbi:MAG: HAD family phosphatase [Nanoarchaeota archaeon]|nr:HAD family phosphatase [Nanoarchaeota archaeon]